MKIPPAAAFWLVIVILVIGVALAAPWLAPSALNNAQPYEQFQPPSGEHWLGTDHIGQDVLGRAMWAARNSLAAALLATLAATVLSVIVGGLAGTVGHSLDWILMRGVDVLLAFPGLLMALALVAILESGPVQAAVAVGAALAPVYSRLVRASTLVVRTRPYVEAARTLGGGPVWVFRRHILPNIAGELIAYVTIIYAWSLLNMAALDFLGVSGGPSTPTWGRMLNEGRAYLRVAPWIALTPGVMLTLSVLAVMGLSETLRRSLPGSQPRG